MYFVKYLGIKHMPSLFTSLYYYMYRILNYCLAFKIYLCLYMYNTGTKVCTYVHYSKTGCYFIILRKTDYV